MINYARLRTSLNAFNYSIGEFMVIVNRAQKQLASDYIYTSTEKDSAKKVVDSFDLAERDVKVLGLTELTRLSVKQKQDEDFKENQSWKVTDSLIGLYEDENGTPIKMTHLGGF